MENYKWITNKEPQKSGYIIWQAGVGEIACLPYNSSDPKTVEKAESLSRQIAARHNNCIDELVG